MIYGLTTKRAEALKFDTCKAAEVAFSESEYDRDNISCRYCLVTKEASVIGPLGTWFGYLCDETQQTI